MFALLPIDCWPIALVTDVEGSVIRSTSWLKDIRTWIGFADDSLPILADIIGETGLAAGRIGVDFGSEMRLGMPLTAFRKLEKLLPKARMVDGSPLLWKLRMIKSDAEVSYIREACAINEKGFRAAWRQARVGITERELLRRMSIALLRAGAEKILWLPMNAGSGNYGKLSMEPTERKLRSGDTLWIDAGVTVKGYWSDSNRNAVVRQADNRQRAAYRAIRDVTYACVDAVRPGIPISDIVKVRDKAFARLGFKETGTRSGRMGHGSGLDITEPPSVGSHDHTIIEPGMVLHIEPRMIHPYGCFQLEEVVAVTKSGFELLSPPSPRELPVAG
jgi:Xaa-Pro aminopeptidase